MQQLLQSADCPTGIYCANDITAIGMLKCLLLLDRMKGGHKSVVRTELEGKLMIRNSCTDVDASTWSDYYI